MQALLKLGTALVALCALGAPSYGQNYFKTGQAILQECAAKDAFIKGECSGYILGVVDSLEAERYVKSDASCLPANPTVQQVTDFILAAIRTRPSLNRTMPAAISITLVYRETCGMWP